MFVSTSPATARMCLTLAATLPVLTSGVSFQRFAHRGSGSSKVLITIAADPQVGMQSFLSSSKGAQSWKDELAMLKAGVAFSKSLREKKVNFELFSAEKNFQNHFTFIAGDEINYYPEDFRKVTGSSLAKITARNKEEVLKKSAGGPMCQFAGENGFLSQGCLTGGARESKKFQKKQNDDVLGVLKEFGADEKLFVTQGNHDVGDVPTVASLEEFGATYKDYLPGGVDFADHTEQLFGSSKKANIQAIRLNSQLFQIYTKPSIGGPVPAEFLEKLGTEGCPGGKHDLPEIKTPFGPKKWTNPDVYKDLEKVALKREEQMAFLEKQIALAASQKKKTLVIFTHIPPFVTDHPEKEGGELCVDGRDGQWVVWDKLAREAFQRAAAKAADLKILVIAGHLHANVAAKAKNIQVIVTSAVGAPILWDGCATMKPETVGQVSKLNAADAFNTHVAGPLGGFGNFFKCSPKSAMPQSSTVGFLGLNAETGDYHYKRCTVEELLEARTNLKKCHGQEISSSSSSYARYENERPVKGVINKSGQCFACQDSKKGGGKPVGVCKKGMTEERLCPA